MCYFSSDENGGENSYVKYKAKDSKGRSANIIQIGFLEPDKIIVEYGDEHRMYYVEGHNCRTNLQKGKTDIF